MSNIFEKLAERAVYASLVKQANPEGRRANNKARVANQQRVLGNAMARGQKQRHANPAKAQNKPEASPKEVANTLAKPPVAEVSDAALMPGDAVPLPGAAPWKLTPPLKSSVEVPPDMPESVTLPKDKGPFNFYNPMPGFKEMGKGLLNTAKQNKKSIGLGAGAAALGGIGTGIALSRRGGESPVDEAVAPAADAAGGTDGGSFAPVAPIVAGETPAPATTNPVAGDVPFYKNPKFMLPAGLALGGLGLLGTGAYMSSRKKKRRYEDDE